jgi:hypothetical protein
MEQRGEDGGDRINKGSVGGCLGPRGRGRDATASPSGRSLTGGVGTLGRGLHAGGDRELVVHTAAWLGVRCHLREGARLPPTLGQLDPTGSGAARRCLHRQRLNKSTWTHPTPRATQPLRAPAGQATCSGGRTLVPLPRLHGADGSGAAAPGTRRSSSSPLFCRLPQIACGLLFSRLGCCFPCLALPWDPSSLATKE